MFGNTRKTRDAEGTEPAVNVDELASRLRKVVRAEDRPEVAKAREHVDRLSERLERTREEAKRADLILANRQERLARALGEGGEPDRGPVEAAEAELMRLRGEVALVERAVRRGEELEAEALVAAEEATYREFRQLYDALSDEMNRRLLAAAEVNRHLVAAYEEVAPAVLAPRLRSRVEPRGRAFLSEGVARGHLPISDPERARGMVGA